MGERADNTTYTAWNGDEKPWPPPENWYRAADGRWWHPAYGPDDPPDEVHDIDEILVTETEDPEAEPEPEDPEPEPIPVLGPEAEPELEDPEPQPVVARAAMAPPTTPEPEADRSSIPQPVPAADNAPRRSRRARHAALLVAGAAIMSAIAATPILLRDNGSDPVPTRTTEPAAATETAGTDTQADSGPTDAAGAGAVGRFRADLNDHGLSTDDLTDDQIEAFASAYCARAAVIEDQAAYEELRENAVDTIEAGQTNLTPDQLGTTIAAAIIAFCPEESERLGIGYESSP